MTKKEMAAKIAALEAQVSLLSSQVAQRPVAVPYDPYQRLGYLPQVPYRVTVSGSTSSLSSDISKYLAHNSLRSAS